MQPNQEGNSTDNQEAGLGHRDAIDPKIIRRAFLPW